MMPREQGRTDATEENTTTISKSTRRVAHADRLALPMLGVRLIIELGYVSCPLEPFPSRAEYTTTIPIISQR